MVTVLSQDAFVDVLGNRTTTSPLQPCIAATFLLAALKFSREELPTLCGPCWKCGQHGQGERKARPLNNVCTRSPVRTCYENCGQWDHLPAATRRCDAEGKCSRAGSMGYSQAKSSQVPPLCKLLLSRCTGGQSVRRSGQLPMSSGGGHWCDNDLCQGGSSGSSILPCIRLGAVQCNRGNCTMLRGPVIFKIGVGGVEEELPIFVANMEEPCLLGLDFLVQSAVYIELERVQMKVYGEIVLLLCTAEQLGTPWLV
ncbi:hypothetical protein E2C01_061074 [Portunus trituberculatus]|uniref:Uncharacterized protein n=1 Tax=Portunus trituberculatus TaxID=210409 RepID=A0A5B7HDD3_PORTR|nr:hypothetical protein [Portunus trituberculatus]